MAQEIRSDYIESLKAENEELYQKSIKAYQNSEHVYEYIRRIAFNIEKICEHYNQKEYISSICSRIVVHFKTLGYERLGKTVYDALEGIEYSRFKNNKFTGRKFDSSNDLPEDISIEMKQQLEAINILRNTDWSRYPNRHAQQINSAASEIRQKLDSYHDQNNIINLTKSYDPLEENKKRSQYYPKRPLQQPEKDNEPNCISKQYEYLTMDIQNFVENFLKHYYPPPEHRPYYAYAVKITRKFFSQYASDKIHRDYKSWSDILAADLKLIPNSDKSAKEVSARYGLKIRRHDKKTGEPIYGRKGICKEQIQKKRPSLVEFLKDVYKIWPVFLLTSHLYSQTKEKVLVDHTIDMRDKRQHCA
jgi:hypothetical protein